jgi:uncharacterized membrane protein (DUF4010 family)
MRVKFFPVIDCTLEGDFLQVLWYNVLMYFDLLQQFGTALALSILIGLEREQKKKLMKDEAFAGVRTFSLIGLLGALAFYFLSTSVVLFGLVAGVVFALIVASYIVVASRCGRIGLTTEIAAVVTFLIGGLCASGQYVLAVGLTLVTVAVLYFKVRLHKWAKSFNEEELVSTIKFMIIAFIVLPLLPNQGFGPYEVFNPYVIWLMVVFVSGISFASYIAIKLIGPRKGIGVTGFLAGLISSTALALSFSKESKENKSIVNPYVFAVVVASTAMYLRVLLEIFVLNREMLPMALIPMLSMALVGVIASVVFWFWKDKKGGKKLAKNDYKLKSPFRLAPALQFGLFFAIILFVSKLGQIYFGDSGVYGVSVISGFVDMDAITVSMAKLGNEIGMKQAVTAIVLASFSNTVFKGGVFMFFGARKAGLRIFVTFGLMIVAGVLSLLFI